MADNGAAAAKGHRAPQAGAKFNKKKARDRQKKGIDKGQKNPKAFTYASGVRAARSKRRNLDRSIQREHVPMVNRLAGVTDPPPFTVVVVGPPGCGKSTLVKGLVKHYTNQNLAAVKGPITVIAGKKRRLTFFECPNDLNAMVDLAKIADLALILVDASFGFEMEVFEFLNILKVHGFPKVMGVLTHLDSFRKTDQLNTAKKKLKHRFWTEICDGAKLFYLSGLINGKYPKREIMNLARFISVMKFRPLSWVNSHPFVLADRLEDITDPARIEANPKCDRTVAAFGFVRGTFLKPSQAVHFLGVDDFDLTDMTLLPDPVPLTVPKEKKTTLSEKEKKLFAPMSDVGDVMYDKDAVYIKIKDQQINFSKPEDLVPDSFGEKPTRKQTQEAEGAEGEDVDQRALVPAASSGPGEDMVRSLQELQQSFDERMTSSALPIFKGAQPVVSADVSSSSSSSSSSSKRGQGSSREGLSLVNKDDVLRLLYDSISAQFHAIYPVSLPEPASKRAASASALKTPTKTASPRAGDAAAAAAAAAAATPSPAKSRRGSLFGIKSPFSLPSLPDLLFPSQSAPSTPAPVDSKGPSASRPVETTEDSVDADIMSQSFASAQSSPARQPNAQSMSLAQLLPQLADKLQDLEVAGTCLQSCFPEVYEVLSFFITAYHQNVCLILRNYCPSSWTDLGLVLQWVNEYDQTLKHALQYHTACDTMLLEDLVSMRKLHEPLQHSFIRKVQNGLAMTAHDVANSQPKAELSRDDKGYFRTDGPALILSQILDKLDMVKQSFSLDEHSLPKVFQMVCEVLTVHQHVLCMMASTDILEKPRRFYMAQMNNCQSYKHVTQEMVQRFKQLATTPGKPELTQRRLKDIDDKFEPVFDSFEQYKQQCGKALSTTAMAKLTDPLNEFFTEEWYNGSAPVSQVIQTLRDEFTMIFPMLIPANLGTFLGAVIADLNTRYLARFMQSQLNLKQHPKVIVRMAADEKMLTGFFSTFQEHLTDGVLHASKDYLSFIFVALTKDASQVEEQFSSMIMRLGSGGAFSIINTAINMRADLKPAKKKALLRSLEDQLK